MVCYLPSAEFHPHGLQISEIISYFSGAVSIGKKVPIMQCVYAYGGFARIFFRFHLLAGSQLNMGMFKTVSSAH